MKNSSLLVVSLMLEILVHSLLACFEAMGNGHFCSLFLDWLRCLFIPYLVCLETLEKDACWLFFLVDCLYIESSCLWGDQVIHACWVLSHT